MAAAWASRKPLKDKRGGNPAKPAPVVRAKPAPAPEVTPAAAEPPTGEQLCDQDPANKAGTEVVEPTPMASTAGADAGGELRASTPVRRITVSSGRATGVVLHDGDVISATRAVIAGVTPTQLYGGLLKPHDTPDEVRDAAARYRYGRAGMQIHIALDEAPRWKGPRAERLAGTAIVHVTPGLDGVSRAVNEAERGLLPAEATIVAGQPCAVDPSRAPEGKWIVWIQLQELPAGQVKGDAAGELDVGDGTWTEELREAYADRIVARLGESIENLASATLRRIALSPADLEALNPNLVAGDIYAGSCALDQNLLWRPFAAAPGHRTSVEGLWHVGASTHPGPGLGAGSGYLVAKELTRPPLARRLVAKLPRVSDFKSDTSR